MNRPVDPTRRRTLTASRRGVSSVLSMMFLVIFGSLGAAMAVVAQGNLRTADSAIRVSRAMSAAETGLVFATRRLSSEASRFVVRRGVIDPTLADQLWRGTYSPSDPGDLVVMPPDGYEVVAPPAGIAQALIDAHHADVGAVDLEPGDAQLPAFDNVTGRLDAKPIRIGGGEHRASFRLSYRPLANTSRILGVSEGRDGDVTRTLQMEFELDKRIEFAILSPNRIMIGKNVLVEGPIGTTFGIVDGEINTSHGQPVVMRSDFRYLDPDLDAAIASLEQAVEQYDVDGDNRLRIHHPIEMSGLAVDPSLVDVNGDEFVDEFDLFLDRFDTDGDGRVVWDPARAVAAGSPFGEPEFAGVDDQLARLLDLARADRNGDGVVDADDLRLGRGDGVIDILDRPAKLRGDLRLAVTSETWETESGGPWTRHVRGSIRAEDKAPATFGLGQDELRTVTTDMFAESAVWFDDQATTDLLSELGIASWNAWDPTELDAAAVADPESTAEGWVHEEVPFGSPNAYDWYRRPVIVGRTFTNLRIPTGANALFKDCIFLGVTYIETGTSCSHQNWNFFGTVHRSGEAPDFTYEAADWAESLVPAFDHSLLPPGSPPGTKALSNNIRFHDCTFLGSLAGDTPDTYTHWRNKIQVTGGTRLYNRPDDPDLLAQADGPLLAAALASIDSDDLAELRKSSMMLPGWSVDVGNFDNTQSADPDLTPRIRMTGTVVAGVFDVRGTAEIEGTLLLTFRPTASEGPLRQPWMLDAEGQPTEPPTQTNGQPHAFNTTIGYFGQADGDGEGVLPGSDTFEGFGEILLRWDPDADLPDGIPWPIKAVPLRETYREARMETSS
jgi:hypothetical protein